MNKKQIDFLLSYAKIGVLSEKDNLDEIAFDEIKTEYANIKTELTNPLSQSILSKPEALAKIKDTTRPGEKKSAVKDWFNNIGKRQKAYQDTHKGELM